MCNLCDDLLFKGWFQALLKQVFKLTVGGIRNESCVVLELSSILEHGGGLLKLAEPGPGLAWGIEFAKLTDECVLEVGPGDEAGVGFEVGERTAVHHGFPPGTSCSCERKRYQDDELDDWHAVNRN